MKTLIRKYSHILQEYLSKDSSIAIGFIIGAAMISVWVSDIQGIFNKIALILLYCSCGILHFNLITGGAFARFINKIWPMHPFCPKWDAKVNNWLCQDDLGIKPPKYNSILFRDILYCIDTPIGTIWVANFPYSFGSKHDTDNPKQIFVPSLEVQKKLKMKIEELFDVFYNEESARFEQKS
jgi:hypothetical protein